MAAPAHWRRNELLDFTGSVSSRGLRSKARLSAGGVYVCRAELAANEGVEIGVAQLSAIIVESAPFDVEWRAPSDNRSRHDWLLPNSAQIAPAGDPFLLRWKSEPTILAIAFDSKLVDKLHAENGGKRIQIHPQLGIRDAEIEAIISKFRVELRFGGASGPLYLESLGVILAVRLLQHYAGEPPRHTARGGLGSRRLRKVIDYVEAHLGEPLSLGDLAEIVELTPHHFAGAFRTSTGVSPHRYIMERRILRSFELLAEPDATVTTVAHALGFSSHGHFTAGFHRFVGVTPSQFQTARR